MGEGRCPVSEAYPSTLAHRARELRCAPPDVIQGQRTLMTSALPRKLDVMSMYHCDRPRETRNWTSGGRV